MDTSGVNNVVVPAGKVDATKVHGRWFFAVDHLLLWLAECEIESTDAGAKAMAKLLRKQIAEMSD